MPGKIVSQEEWLEARRAFLVKEKELTRQSDRIARERAELPMTLVSKDYTFTGSDGTVSLLDLFDGKKQLIVQHVMFDPKDEQACPGCSFHLDNLPAYLQHLRQKDTNYVGIARAPYEKLHKFCKERMGWSASFYSSLGSDFNYDYNVTQDEDVKQSMYNFVVKEKSTDGKKKPSQELPGMSVFYRDGDKIYHSYSTYARGVDHLLSTFALLDLTPLGRQDASPGFEYHDKYDS